jgi:hypothetical protein
LQNNRSNSFVNNGTLNIFPTLLADTIGQANLQNGFDLNIWGGDPASTCTDNFEYGCERTSGAGGNYLNPIQSAKLRTAETFAFRYGRVEVVAKLPKVSDCACNKQAPSLGWQRAQVSVLRCR